MNVLKFGVAVMALLTVTSCKQEETKAESVVDSTPNAQVVANDAKTFKTFTFGDRVWMVENLKVNAEGKHVLKDGIFLQ